MKWFFGITIALVIFQLTESIYDGRIQEQTNFHENNLIDVDDIGQGTECPKGFTGQIPYVMDCRQFLNCWKGQGTIQNCAPGTMFNPKSLECDHPSKVKCRRFDEYRQSPPLIRMPPPILRVECNPGAHGLFAHPTDCAKFLNCNHGATVIQDCGPGTVFNAVLQVCDWPHNTDCTNRQSTNGNHQPHHEVDDVPPYYGEGIIQARMNPSATGSSAYRSSNNNNINTNPNLNYHSSAAPLPPTPYGNGNANDGFGRLTQPTDTPITSTDNHNTFNQLNHEGRADTIDQEVYNPNTKFIKCKPDWVGLYPHPFDCRKFLNCNHGATFIQDCGPGTAFNPTVQVCDWPYNVDCSRGYGAYDQEHGGYDVDVTNTNILLNHENDSRLSQAETTVQHVTAQPNHVTAQPNHVTYPLLSQHIDGDFKKYFYDESQLKQTTQTIPINANKNNNNLNTQSKHDYDTQNTQLNGNGLTTTNINEYPNTHATTPNVNYQDNYPNSANRNYGQIPISHPNPIPNVFDSVTNDGQLSATNHQNSANRNYGQIPISNPIPNAFDSVTNDGQLSATNHQNSFTVENQRGIQHQNPSVHRSNDGINTIVETTVNKPHANSNNQFYGQNGGNTQYAPNNGNNPYETYPIPSATNFNPVNTHYDESGQNVQNINSDKRQNTQFHNRFNENTEFNRQITENPNVNGNSFGNNPNLANPQLNGFGHQSRTKFIENSLNEESHPIRVDSKIEIKQNGPGIEGIVVTKPSQFPQFETIPITWNQQNDLNIVNDKDKDVQTNLVDTNDKQFDRNGKSNPNIKLFERNPFSFDSQTGYVGECTVQGLIKHPYDCSKFVSCENGTAYAQNCAPGTLFHPVLKICDFAHKVNCSAGPPLPEQFGISYDLQPPKFDMNEPSSVLISNGYSKTTKNTPSPVTKIPSYQPSNFPIPNMSVLPLSRSNDDAKYPVESEEDERKEPTTPAPLNTKPVYYPNLARPSLGTDTAPEDIETFLQQIHRPNDQVNRDSKSVVVNEPISRPIIPKEKEHIMPIYQRRTTTSTPPSTLSIQNQYASQNEYNRAAPNNQYDSKPIDKKTQTDYLPLNEALKLLLRPYVTEMSNETTTKMLEKKILILADQKNDTKTDHTATLEQPSLAHALFNDNGQHSDGVNRDANDDYYAHLNSFDRTQKHDQNCQHYHPPSTFFHLPPNFQHSPEFHEYLNRKHALSNKEFYVGENSLPSNVELLPGTELHQNGYHHPPPAPLHHHPHHPYNHHRNYQNNDNRWSPYPSRPTAPTTNSLAAPDLDVRFSQTTVPQFTNAHSSRALVDSFQGGQCTNQFNCQNGLCVPFSKVCDGRNDCGNRYDESSCQHVGYEIRLSNERGQRHMGRVEVKAFGRWGYVCDDKFSMVDANVVCRELGFKLGAAEVKTNSYYAPNANMSVESMFIMDEVNCTGSESSLRECNFNGWGISDCNAEEVVGVVCKVPAMKCPSNYFLCEASEQCIPINFMCDGVNDCSDGADESRRYCNAPIEYRLADGNEFEGRVEVKYRGIWGTVCDDDFGEAEATVVCKSLGYYGPTEILNEHIGYASGPIWLDQVSCLGNETFLDKCMHFQWGESNCNHTEDISVRCSHGAPRKSASYVMAQDDNTLDGFDAETKQYLRENQRSRKSVADYSNTCGQMKVGKDDVENSAEQLGQFRVISGTRTKRGHHPWQATIRVRGQNGRSNHWCGGVVISKNHILTAAHCLVGYGKGSYFIRLGDHHSEIYEDSEIEIFIEDWFIHEEFRKGQHMNNDIAVILLKQPIQFTNYIQPICLPKNDANYAPGLNCTISGWGSIQYGQSTPSLDLKAASVPIIPQHICRQKHIYGDAIMDTMFCAGYLDQSGVDACDGDSGGPLVCADQSGINSLYGIISWGQRCGDSTKPGVYVKIAKYIDWIKDKMNMNRETRRH